MARLQLRLRRTISGMLRGEVARLWYLRVKGNDTIVRGSGDQRTKPTSVRKAMLIRVMYIIESAHQTNRVFERCQTMLFRDAIQFRPQVVVSIDAKVDALQQRFHSSELIAKTSLVHASRVSSLVIVVF